MKHYNKRWPAVCVSCVLALTLLSGCFLKVDPSETGGQAPGQSTASLPAQDGAREAVGSLAAPSLPKSAADTLDVSLFVDGSRSMMGFVDWDANFEPRYTGVVSRLLGTLDSRLNTNSARYYRFDLDLPERYMQLSKETLYNNYGKRFFYNYREYDTIPAHVPRTNAYGQVMTVEPVAGWYETQFPAEEDRQTVDEAISQGLPVSDYSIITQYFDQGEGLNILVTDLYGLQTSDPSSQLDILRSAYIASGKAVGILAVECEFSGILPNLYPDVPYRLWGKAPTNAYVSHQDTSYYWVNESQEQVYIRRVDIYGMPLEKRMEEIHDRTVNTRPVYIIFAGMREDVVQAVDTLAEEIDSYYSDGIDYSCELYFPDQVDAIIDTKDIQIFTHGNIVELSEGRYEMRRSASGDTPRISLSMPYTRNSLLDNRTVSPEDFLIEGILTAGGKQMDLSALDVGLSYDAGRLLLDCDFDGLPQGEYTLDLAVSVTPVKRQYQAFARWYWEIDQQDIYRLAHATDEVWSGEAHYDRTAGLSALVKMLGDRVNEAAEPTALCKIHLELNKVQ